MAEKGCGMINGNSRVIWPQYTSKTSVTIRGKVDPEFLYGVGTEEDEAHISGHIIRTRYRLLVNLVDKQTANELILIPNCIQSHF